MGKGKGPKDPFGTYVEWGEQRLNPGHYLGGTIEPHLRTSALGPRARRRSGILLVISGLASFVFFISLGGAMSADFPRPLVYIGLIAEAAVSMLVVGAGMVLYRSAETHHRSTRVRRRRK
jgi:hypothetical protein